MNKKLLATFLAVTLLLTLGAPSGIALAKPKISKFSAQGTLFQTSVGLPPEPILNKLGQQVGVILQGEVFEGSITSCADHIGEVCTLLTGSTMTAVQDATLLFTGLPDPSTGSIRFVGKVSGTFTIGDLTGQVTGTYNGIVRGTLTPLPSPPFPAGAMLLDDVNGSIWQVTEATGDFAGLENSLGRIVAQLGGIFPGAEQIDFTIEGIDR